MGIDVDWRGSATDRPWTSLAEAIGAEVAADVLLAALVDALSGSIDGLVRDEAALLSAYRRRCATIGRPVAIERPGGGRLEGIAVAVDDAGRLVVEAGGATTSIDAGDVIHLRSVPSDRDTRERP
jgi:BirA family biotin operon repressor/biotin-[acetyl-CoA-carboxylase] ligase